MSAPRARICQLTCVETMYNFLAPLFRALRDDGHDVVAACNLDAGGRDVSHYLGTDYPIHQIHGARSVTWRTFTTDVVALARYLRTERFDVVHVHSPLVAIQARLAARMARVPRVIYHAHGFAFHDGMGRFSYRVAYAVERFFARHLTDAVVTVSAEDTELARRGRFRPRPEQVVYAPGVGIDTERFHPVRPDTPLIMDGSPLINTEVALCREELGIPADALVIAFVGRLVGEKGVRELIHAFGSVAATHPNAWLLVAGDTLDSERDQTMGAFLDSARQAPFGPRLVLAGRRTDVPRLLRAADIFVLPSYREGMPVSLMEAMATGLPCVATTIRGCREAIQDGESGLLVPPRDAAALGRALEQLARDATLRSRLGAAARARAVLRYSVAASLLPQLELYRALLSEAGPDGAGAGRAENDKVGDEAHG